MAATSQQRPRGTSWGKSKVTRQNVERSTTAMAIGPGSYTLQKTTITPNYKFKPNAAFASKVTRGSYIPSTATATAASDGDSASSDEEGDTEVPGPGYYFNDN